MRMFRFVGWERRREMRCCCCANPAFPLVDTHDHSTSGSCFPSLSMDGWSHGNQLDLFLFFSCLYDHGVFSLFFFFWFFFRLFFFHSGIFYLALRWCFFFFGYWEMVE